MNNKKVLIDALKNLGSAKAPAVKKDVIVNPNMGAPAMMFPQASSVPMMKSGGTKMLSVKKSTIDGAGKGLFAEKGFRKNQLIGLAHEDGQPVGEIGNMHNHSDNPNMYSVMDGNRRYVYAKRDIQPGEELTTNYRLQPELEQPEDFMRRGGSTPKLPKKKNSKAYSRSIEATNRLFAQNPLFAKTRSRKNKIYDPNAKYYQDGGASSPQEWGQEIKDIESQIGNPSGWTLADYNLLQNKLNAYQNWRENTPEGQAVIDSHNVEGEYDIPLPEHLQDYTNAMMKARLAYANQFGNPAAQRMIVAPDQPYDFGNGNYGTHYMASMDNYAVPQIQDVNGQLVLGDFGPSSNEAMRFDNPDDAQYFAEHYKEVSPAFIETELTPEEIEEYAKGGYIIEDISVPSLTKAQNGLSVLAKNLGKLKSVNPQTLQLLRTEYRLPTQLLNSLSIGATHTSDFLPNLNLEQTSKLIGFQPTLFPDLLNQVGTSSSIRKMGDSYVVDQGFHGHNKAFEQFDKAFRGSGIGNQTEGVYLLGNLEPRSESFARLPALGGYGFTDSGQHTFTPYFSQVGIKRPEGFVNLSDPISPTLRKRLQSNKSFDINNFETLDYLKASLLNNPQITTSQDFNKVYSDFGDALLNAGVPGYVQPETNEIVVFDEANTNKQKEQLVFSNLNDAAYMAYLKAMNKPADSQTAQDKKLIESFSKFLETGDKQYLIDLKKNGGTLAKAQLGKAVSVGKSLSKAVRPSLITQATQTIPEATSLIKLSEFTNKFKPEALNIKFPLVLEGNSGLVQLVPNTKNIQDNLWHFGATMTNPIEAGKAMMLANQVFPYPNPSILEPYSLSLDSYNMLLNMGRRKDWDMTYENDVPLNWLHEHSELFKGLNTPSSMSVGFGIDDKTADQMVLRLNDYLTQKGLTDQAYRVGPPGVSNMNRIYVPNYKLTRKYQNGGPSALAAGEEATGEDPATAFPMNANSYFSNWYQNRQLPFEQIGSKSYERVLKQFLPAYNPESPLLEELQESVPYEYMDIIQGDPNAMGELVYDNQGNPQKIVLKESLKADPEELNATIAHEERTRLWDKYRDKILPAEQIIIQPNLKSFEEGWGNLKGAERQAAEEYYDYLTDPNQDNIQSLIFEVRQKKGLQPTQVITDDDIKNWKQEAEKSGALDKNSPNYDPALYNLFKIVKDDAGLKDLFNYIAKNDNEDSQEGLQYAQQGGFTGYELGDEVDAATMKQLKKLGYTFEKV